MRPYTYLIGWENIDRWYYGVRFAKGCDPTDLWNPYKTSSKHVRNMILEYGEPTYIKVRKVFGCVNDAREWETRVLKRLRVVKNERWLNRTDNKSIEPQYGEMNSSKRPDIKELISRRTKENTPRGDKHPRRINPEKWVAGAMSTRGRTNHWSTGDMNPMHKPEVKLIFKEKYSGENSHRFGKTNSQRQRDMTSERFLGVPKKKVTCPHCSTTGGVNTMSRWHFNNCKHKK